MFDILAGRPPLKRGCTIGFDDDRFDDLIRDIRRYQTMLSAPRVADRMTGHGITDPAQARAERATQQGILAAMVAEVHRRLQTPRNDASR